MVGHPLIPVIGRLRRIAINFGGDEIVLGRLAGGEIDADAIITGRVARAGVVDAFDTLRAPDDHVEIMVLPRGFASV